MIFVMSFLIPSMSTRHEWIETEIVQPVVNGPHVLDVFSDSDCRTIFLDADTPLTVPEIIDQYDLPKSTVYRKMQTLTDHGLVRTIESQHLGSNTAATYQRCVDEVRIIIRDSVRIEYVVSPSLTDPVPVQPF